MDRRVRPEKRVAGLRALLRRIGGRRTRITRAGAAVSGGTLAVGLAAVNTGNNLLYLLLGALLGLIVLGGILAERSLRAVRVDRQLPRAVTAGVPFRVTYRFRNLRRGSPAVAIEARDRMLDAPGFAAEVPPRSEGTVQVFGRAVAEHRGLYQSGGITLSTGYPFGFFRRERDFDQAADLIVWPRSDREPDRDVWGEERVVGRRMGSARPASGRGEFRALREYRPGDDRKDIHWRRTARLGAPVIREYERGAGETVWVCLDTSWPPGDAAEEAVERAASNAAYALRDGRRVGLLHARARIEPESGTQQLERILDELARVEFGTAEPMPRAPERGRRVVVVTPRATEPAAAVEGSQREAAV